MGDSFLRETFDVYQNLKVGARVQRKRPPYLHEMYNVLGYYQAAHSMLDGLSRIVNALVEGLNKRLRLPKFIIVILDMDILKLIKKPGNRNSNVDIFHYVKACLVWIIKQVSTLLQRKRIDLFDKKPGSLAKDPPKVVWVKMLRRPDDVNFNEVIAMRSKFNKALEESLYESSYTDHFVLTINAEPADFTPMGTLNGIGKIAYWKEIDACMRKFDRGEINLRPRAPIPMQRTSIVNKPPLTQKRFKLSRKQRRMVANRQF